MDLSRLTPAERLAAEQAVLTLRALNDAAEQAPVGQGLARLEAVIHAEGFDHLRQLMPLAAGARPEAQKRGPASVRARRAAGGGRSRTSMVARS